MNDLEQLIKWVHSRILLLRNFEHLIRKPLFADLWEDSDEDCKRELRNICLSLDKQALIKWLRNHPALDIGELPYVQLKELAKLKQVPHYSRMSKIQLLRVLQND